MENKIANWFTQIEKWKRDEESGISPIVEIVSSKDMMLRFFDDLHKSILDKSMRQILQSKGLVKLISISCTLPALVTISNQGLSHILGTILQAPPHILSQPDSKELRAHMWASHYLLLLLPSLRHLEGDLLSSEVGLDRINLQKSYVTELAVALSKRLSAPLPSSSLPSSHSSPSLSPSPSTPVSSSLGFPYLSPSPFPLQELSRLCLLIIEHPDIFPVIDRLICLQPGMTSTSQLDPIFVAHILKGEVSIFSKLSLAAKSALWIHSSEVFSLLAADLIARTKQAVFSSEASLESLVKETGLFHLLPLHPSLFFSFLSRLEAEWMNTRDFSSLLLARLVTSFVSLHVKFNNDINQFFPSPLSTFAAILGRTKEGERDKDRKVGEIEKDAGRMNAEREKLIASPRLSISVSHLWIVQFCFVDWTCQALLSLLFSKTPLQSVAEYVAWLVNPGVEEEEGEEELKDMLKDEDTKERISHKSIAKELLSTQINSEEENEKKRRKMDENRGGEGSGGVVEQKVLECIGALPIPRELSLKVMEKYISGKDVLQKQASFLVQFALFGKEKDKSLQDIPPPTQAMGLNLLEKLSISSSLSPSTKEVILDWLEKIEKACKKTPHEKTVIERGKEIRSLISKP